MDIDSKSFEKVQAYKSIQNGEFLNYVQLLKKESGGKGKTAL